MFSCITVILSLFSSLFQRARRRLGFVAAGHDIEQPQFATTGNTAIEIQLAANPFNRLSALYELSDDSQSLSFESDIYFEQLSRKEEEFHAVCESFLLHAPFGQLIPIAIGSRAQ